MMNPDDFLYEYSVVRYVPRVDREEFVNIGLIMMCKRRRWLLGKIEFDEARLKAFDPHVNFEILRKQSSIFTRSDVPSADIPIEERYRWLSAVKSAVLQVSPSHPGIIITERETDRETAIKILEKEFEKLFEEKIG